MRLLQSGHKFADQQRNRMCSDLVSPGGDSRRYTPHSDLLLTKFLGWDGTSALGGAVEVAKPARMLEDIRAAGEALPSDCEVFNANVEMSGDDLKFEEVIEMIDTYYESQDLVFKNGDVVNQQGENEGSAKILSYAALAGLDKETTLKVCSLWFSTPVLPQIVWEHELTTS